MSLGDRVRFLLVTGGGLGLAPIVSGTFGTLGGVAAAVALQLLVPVAFLAAALGGLALLLFFWGCAQTGFVHRTFQGEDPGEFVLDEIVGYLAGMAMLVSVHGSPGVLDHLVCFLVFRGFDVVKPLGVRRLERVAGARGIMLDDLLAGIYTGGVMISLSFFALP